MDLSKLFAGKKGVLFGVPGAFTPGCSATHLPGYLAQLDALKAKGVAEVACLAVNDPFVMKVCRVNTWVPVSNSIISLSLVING